MCLPQINAATRASCFLSSTLCARRRRRCVNYANIPQSGALVTEPYSPTTAAPKRRSNLCARTRHRPHGTWNILGLRRRRGGGDVNLTITFRLLCASGARWPQFGVI